jgi:MscS family membrane protein
MSFWSDIIANLTEFLDFIINYKDFTQLVMAIFVIVFAIFLRKLVEKIVLKILKRLAKKTKTVIDDLLLEVLEKPIQMIIVVLGFYIATMIMGFPENLHMFLVGIFKGFFLFIIFWSLYRGTDVLSKVIERLFYKTENRLDDMLAKFINKGIKVIIVSMGFITILQSVGTDIAALLTGLGLGGLAFALAFKDTASNLFGSITIMIDRPFSLGDWIETSEGEGTVEDIGFRTTKIRTFSKALLFIPNSIMSSSAITNWSRMTKRRIKYQIGLTYSSNVEKLQGCIEDLRKMLFDHPEIHKEQIYVYFENFGDSALEIFMCFFTSTTNWQEYLRVREDVNFKIMKIVVGAGLSFAFPSRSIYIEKEVIKGEDSEK